MILTSWISNLCWRCKIWGSQHHEIVTKLSKMWMKYSTFNTFYHFLNLHIIKMDFFEVYIQFYEFQPTYRLMQHAYMNVLNEDIETSISPEHPLLLLLFPAIPEPFLTSIFFPNNRLMPPVYPFLFSEQPLLYMEKANICFQA